MLHVRFAHERLPSFMLRKLYALVSKSCSVDNPDSPQHQEVLLPGTLYAMIIKERLEEALNSFRDGIALDVRNTNPAVDFFDSELEIICAMSVLSGPHRAIYQEGPCAYKLRLRLEDVQFPCDWKLGVPDRSGPTASIWLHHRCRKAKLAAVYQSFPLHSSRCFLCRTQNDDCP